MQNNPPIDKQYNDTIKYLNSLKNKDECTHHFAGRVLLALVILKSLLPFIDYYETE